MTESPGNLSFSKAINWARERITNSETIGGRFLDKIAAVSLNMERWMEAKARLEIGMRAVLIDRRLPNNPDKNFSYRVMGDMFGALEQIAETSGGFPLRVLKTDSVTGEEYSVEINRQGTMYEAAEIRSDQSLISKAVISEDKTELSLNFSGDRYDKLEADLKINQADDLPLATRVVFKLLAGSVIQAKSDPKFR